METSITVQVEPGELYQVGRRHGLSYTAAEQLNRLSSVELAVSFTDDGGITSVDIVDVHTKDHPNARVGGWPFKHRPQAHADEQMLQSLPFDCNL